MTARVAYHGARTFRPRGCMWADGRDGDACFDRPDRSGRFVNGFLRVVEIVGIWVLVALSASGIAGCGNHARERDDGGLIGRAALDPDPGTATWSQVADGWPAGAAGAM